jgi:ABC-type multidrug transport system ATPase subunit
MKKQPSVLLLDEPTSGLDSGGSMELIRVLRQLADDRGITVVAVIHQPSFALLALFDSIVLLSKGGRMAYAGPVKSMKSYFEDLGFVFNSNENAVDVCLDAVSGLRTSTNPCCHCCVHSRIVVEAERGAGGCTIRRGKRAGFGTHSQRL